MGGPFCPMKKRDGRGLALFGSKAKPSGNYAEKRACPRILTGTVLLSGTGPFLCAAPEGSALRPKGAGPSLNHYYK